MCLHVRMLILASAVLCSLQAIGQGNKPPAQRAGDPEVKADGGSDFLREIRRRTEPVLAAMTKQHGYGLSESEMIKRVPPPFPATRMDYYRSGHPSQAEAIPAGPSAIAFDWEDGRLTNAGMTFGSGADSGFQVEALMDIVLGLKSQSVQGPKALRRRAVPGDWIIERGKAFDPEKARVQLERILQEAVSPKLRLTVRDVVKDCYVAKGAYVHSAGDPSQAKKNKLFLTEETYEVDEIDIYGKARYLEHNSGGGSGDISEFFDWLGRWIEVPIVNEIETPPDNLLSWTLHGQGSHKDDHSSDLVLPNITFQTGLTFTKERRPIRTVSIEESP